MKENLSDITVVLDRSGSMTRCQSEAENGLNHFIEEQKALSGECKIALPTIVSTVFVLMSLPSLKVLLLSSTHRVRVALHRLTLRPHARLAIRPRVPGKPGLRAR